MRPRPSDDSSQPAFSPSPFQRLPPLYDQKKAPLPSCPPPTYAQARDAPAQASVFPPMPTTELAPIQPALMATQKPASDNTLPSLSALTGKDMASPSMSSPSSTAADQAASPSEPQLTRWPSLNPLTAYYTPSFAQGDEVPLKMEVDSNTSGTPSVLSPDRQYDGRGNSLSLDDPDVRMAAEALGDLRAGELAFHHLLPKR